MPYCTWLDVQAKMQHIKINNTSRPTTDQVNGFIDEVSQNMDLRFQAAGITVPVTDPDKLTALVPVAVNGVRAEIYRSILSQLDLAAQLQKLYDKEVDRFCENPSLLTATSPVTGGPGYNQPPSCCRAERFERCKKQW